MIGRALFVSGTDTGVGKTHVTLALIAALQQKSLRVAAYKPIETGVSDATSDAARLQRATGQTLPTIRYGLATPAAPLVAASIEGVAIDLAQLAADLAALRAAHDVVVIEGAGGLLVPLTIDQTFADFAAALRLPTLLVARPGLGTINHTTLSIEAARHRGLPLLGFVFSRVAPPRGPDEPMNALAITRATGVPFLGTLRASVEPCAADLEAVVTTLLADAEA